MTNGGEPQYARPVDDFEALRIAQELIESYRPHLSYPQQLELALRVTPDVKRLGNFAAQHSALAEEIDDIGGQYG